MTVSVIVVMGVSGSGKTTVGTLLAQRLGWPFADADAFHPHENVAKMRAGIPLTDEDRWPWLDAMAAWIDHARTSGKRGVVACSALKRRYRDRIIAGGDDVLLVYLEGTYEVIARRMAERPHHYMPVSLLRSQFEALEPPAPEEGPLVIAVEAPPGEIVEGIYFKGIIAASMTARLSIAIVGGGIGGLFAANALLARGLRVAVYEQATAIGETGAGVYVTPNAVRHLQSVGLGGAVERWGARVGLDSAYYHHDGALIAPVQVTDAAGWNACFGMHRADYVDFLAAHLPAGIIRTGHRAVGFEQTDDIARVKFANGAVAEADVVIGADGIHSELRPHVFPPSKPVFHGTISYRGLVPRERLPDWPGDRWQMWAGPAKHFLVFPVRGGDMVNYVGFVPTDEQMKESWSAPGDPEVLRREFQGWDARVGQVLEQVDRTFRWALYDREPLPTWTQGRLSLLGDAAHPMLPHLGQGANQAIEDGMALAAILARADAASVPACLLAYERLRRERVAEVQLGARRHGLRVDSRVHDLRKRDADLVAHAEFRKQLYSYDVVAHAERAASAALLTSPGPLSSPSR